MTNFFEIIDRLSLIKEHTTFRRLQCFLHQVKGHLLCWAHKIELVLISGQLRWPRRVIFDHIQWIMSKKFVILTTHHRHKPSEFTYIKLFLLINKLSSKSKVCDIKIL
jgi:hypothetical protein